MKTYIWGTGVNAKRVMDNGIKYEITGFLESKLTFPKANVCEPQDLSDYDAVIVASTAADEIYLTARELGMHLDKFIFMVKCHYIDPRENLELKAAVLSEKNFQIYLGIYNIYEKSFFAEDKEKYIRLNTRKEFEIKDGNDYPIITDKYKKMGEVNDYFWQDLWAAKLIFHNFPKEHYDIGSRLDGFIAHILAMDIPIKVIDIRPFPVEIDGMQTIVADATHLEGIEDGSIESFSALCSLEHFGLGRYGDEVNPEACFQCFSKIQKKLAQGGHLYISLPIGKDAVCFNAHRVFRVDTVVGCFHQLKLKELSCVKNMKLEKNIDIHKYDNYADIGGIMGLFYFEK